MNNSAIGHEWEEVKSMLLTPEEIAESDLRVAIIGELIKARNEKVIDQPVIDMAEQGEIDQIDTIIKILAPLGKTLAVVPIKK